MKLRSPLLSALIVLASAPALAAAEGLTKVRIGYVAEPAHGLFFLAQEKGYFKDAGLDAELLEFTSAVEGFNSLLSDKLDVATFGSTGPLFFIAKGADIGIFGGIMIEGQAMLVRPENYEYFKQKDIKIFKGKKIGLIRTTEADFIFKDALKKAGLDWKKDVTIVELPSPAAVTEAVNKKLVDVGFSWPPNYSLAVKNYGLKVPHYFSEYYPRYTCCRLSSTNKKLKEQPQLYKNVLVALIRAYDFYKNHPDETVKIYTKYLKIDEEIVRRETYIDKVADSYPDPLKKTLGGIWDLVVAAGDAPAGSKLDLDAHVNTTLYKQALEEVLAKEPKNATFLALQAEFPKNNN